MDKDGFEVCDKCHGAKEFIIKFTYKGKEYHYYSKCGHCYATGKIDWVEKAKGRLPGIAGFFIDAHPAGSLNMVGKSIDIPGFQSSIYDGHEYIDLDTERGEALYNELITND